MANRFDPNKLKQKFDLLIVGGGINGAGAARDAAERGLKVLLIEKKDFASGCSAHSTRLIHGGLRYLEYLEFGLVKESLKERKILLSNYPNLVKPISLVIPVYKSNRVPAWMLKLGMILYDFLSFSKKLASHRSLSLKELKEEKLNLNPKGLRAALQYYDAQLPFAERLILENIAAAKKAGAICINHFELKKINTAYREASHFIDSIETEDLIDNQVYKIETENLINLSGPWVDEVNKRLDTDLDFKRQMGGTKGSHILVKDVKGAPKTGGVYLEAKSDGRPFFVLPLKVAENSTHYLIGTTDIFSDESLDHLEISSEERDYLLNEVNHFFPNAKLKEKDILKSFVGVRPLPYLKNPKSAAAVSRGHFVFKHESEGLKNYYSVIGGKLTTFRNLSDELISLFTTMKSRTEYSLTPGCDFDGQDYQKYLAKKSKEYKKKYGVELKTAKHLIELYGVKAKQVLDITAENPELKNKIHEAYEDIRAQILYAIRFESAITLEDILYRRLSIGLLNEELDDESLAIIEEDIINELGFLKLS